MSKMRLLLAILPILVLGCTPDVKNEQGEVVGYMVDVDTDHAVSYETGVYSEIDLGVYQLKVRIVGDPGSLTRQVAPASGSVAGVNGFVSGSFRGALLDGKTILRVEVLESDSELAPAGRVIILKSVDTKATMLMPGDVVTFRCRHQEEVIDPVMDRQIPETREEISTWEVDGCKLLEPAIFSTAAPQ